MVSEISTVAAEIDSVQSSIDYTLGANLENLTLTAGVDALSGTGNALSKISFTGNATDNELDGAGGADTLVGGLGDDAYIVNLKTVGTGAAAQAAPGRHGDQKRSVEATTTVSTCAARRATPSPPP